MLPLSEPPSAGGTSRTTGPSRVSKKVMKYIVSGFGVSVWFIQSSGRPQ